MDDYRGLRAKTTYRGMATGLLGAVVLSTLPLYFGLSS